MKHFSRAFIALILAVLVITIMPAQVFADSLPEYISDVKVYMGNYDKAASEGFTILCGDNNKPVDLNQGAGGGWGSKGNKAVYLGYKTTTDRSKAITDLALMNMKGGYSVEEYEALMESQMKSQIIPFVDNFLASINEYRDNYNSENSANRQRARYLHDMLNKLTDDDTGKKLGDLLLNETKYEMGDDAYNKLSDEQKKEHADILTIIAQANGKATLLMENLIIRACDTNDDTWLDRFSETSYEDLEDATDLPPSQAARSLARLYDDDATAILDMFDKFRTELLTYDEALNYIEKYDETKNEAAYDAAESVDDAASDEEHLKIVEDLVEAENRETEYINKAALVAVHDYLDEIEYLDGTMLDFFMTETEELEEEITLLYPLVASLTEGQRAGLDFVSLKELLIIAATEDGAYKDVELDELTEASIYDGVDRSIYQKGGVALTSDTLREKAGNVLEADENPLSTLTILFAVLSCASTAVFLASTVAFTVGKIQIARWPMLTVQHSAYGAHPGLSTNYYNAAVRNARWGGRLMAGFGIAMVIFSAITVYLSYRDMVDHYKVEFTPIPHYMIELTDLVTYNEKGEKIVIKNQSAYYKAVECNRKPSDEYYNTVDTCADMNGDVGKQWLALYAVKNEAMNPILASSLKVVVGDSKLPAGYTTGIHMFGSGAAFNLNSSLYDWNESAKSVIVYFKTDDSVPSATGTNFTGGTLALTGGAGVAVGALATAFAMKPRKKKETVSE